MRYTGFMRRAMHFDKRRQEGEEVCETRERSVKNDLCLYIKSNTSAYDLRHWARDKS